MISNIVAYLKMLKIQTIKQNPAQLCYTDRNLVNNLLCFILHFLHLSLDSLCSLCTDRHFSQHLQTREFSTG